MAKKKEQTEQAVVVAKETAIIEQPQAPQTLGELYDEQFVGNIESDIRYSIASRSLSQARDRMKKIKGGCESLVAQIEADSSEEEAGMAILFIESCRPELVRLYMTINYQFASTTEGQTKIAALADRVIDGYANRLRKEGADPLSLPANAS